ncbi:hypothetical protein EMGBS15_00740 [Filimonas sp.]|jgi:hypothetical protein|nr:hypothetical protein EMGBS15_00740 [Filimonas sp.]
MVGYRISKCPFIGDLSGLGAYLYGGRWNSIGVRMLYIASSASLALLETLVHLPSGLAATDFCMIRLDIPDKEIVSFPTDDLPSGWNRYPSILPTQEIGDAFIMQNKKLALQVPSSIVEMESILLINPAHVNFQKIKVLSTQQIQIDKRLKQSHV